MSVAVADERRAVRPTHHDRLAAPVFNAFDRIGQGGTFEALRIVQDVDNRAAVELIVIEDQFGIWVEDAIARLATVRLAEAIETPLSATVRDACSSM